MDLMGTYLDEDEHVTLLRRIPESFNETYLLSNLCSMASTFICVLLFFYIQKKSSNMFAFRY